MFNYISIATLNDYIFCPYSIYLHNVYMDADDDIYKATPQKLGSSAHEPVDGKTSSTRNNEILSLPVCSDEFGIFGKIDVYRCFEKKLIERKFKLKQIFKGQIYQLWAQYFCMVEMGYNVNELAFYEISTNRLINIDLPGNSGRYELHSFINSFKQYNPAEPINVNPNKCLHCIYCNLCDKTTSENVY